MGQANVAFEPLAMSVTPHSDGGVGLRSSLMPALLSRRCVDVFAQLEHVRGGELLEHGVEEGVRPLGILDGIDLQGVPRAERGGPLALPASRRHDSDGICRTYRDLKTG